MNTEATGRRNAARPAVKWFAFLLLLLLPASAFARKQAPLQLRSGDLIFQDLDCGPMCDAIEEVTTGYKGNRFSHVGLVHETDSALMVIEAVGGGVRQIPLDSFMHRTAHTMYVGRVKKPYRHLIPEAMAFALRQLGKPYDDAFIYGNDKYYCSELIYDAFKAANQDKDFFTLEPMTFKQPGAAAFYPVWINYYRELGTEIPEGKPGCNPGGLSRSPRLDIVGTL